MMEEAIHLSQTHCLDPVQTKTALCLSPAPSRVPTLCNHLLPPPTNHSLLQERNQGIFIFISLALNTAGINESCPICIHHIEIPCGMSVYVSIHVTEISPCHILVCWRVRYMLHITGSSFWFFNILYFVGNWEKRESEWAIFLHPKPSVFFFLLLHWAIGFWFWYTFVCLFICIRFCLL